MIFELKLIRKNHTLTTATGELYLNGEFFSYTLEDVVRGENIKIDRHTAIPAGRYKVKLSMSYRFKRMMPMVYTEPNGYELKNGGIIFKGIRIHGGNTHENSEGCILVAKNFIDENTIQGSMEKELTKRLEELGGEGFITILNKP
jgi:hypothetical protein